MSEANIFSLYPLGDSFVIPLGDYEINRATTNIISLSPLAKRVERVYFRYPLRESFQVVTEIERSLCFERVLSGIDSLVAERFLDTEELVVLGDAVGP